MGNLFSLYCRDCGFSQELRLGVGMLFFGSENLIQMLPQGKREQAPGPANAAKRQPGPLPI